MKQKYFIRGMSCDGCRTKVEDTLNKMKGVNNAEVSLPNLAIINHDTSVSLASLKGVLKSIADKYDISLEEFKMQEESVNKIVFSQESEGKYYCPMFCEGDKVYEYNVGCSVCGMDLLQVGGVEEISKDLKYRLAVALIFSIPLVLIAMSSMFLEEDIHSFISKKVLKWMQFVLILPVVLYSGLPLFSKFYKSVISRNFNMFTLIGIGVIASLIFSVISLFLNSTMLFELDLEIESMGYVYFESVAVIITLVLFGQYLEAKAYSRTNEALSKLIDLEPLKAMMLTPEGREEVAIGELVKEDRVLVIEGERIPVDGIVIKGTGIVDNSMITGEFIPEYKEEGSLVMAGTVLKEGNLQVMVEKLGNQTVLSSIIKMVQEASRAKIPIQKAVDKVANYFVPMVLIVSVLTFLWWFFIEGTISLALVNSISVLIIACPCALGLATPISILIGLNRGALNGILVRDASVIEQIKDMKVMILDKTGSLTKGLPRVVEFHRLSDLNNQDKSIYKSIAENSNHPLSKALVTYLKDVKSTSLQSVDNNLGKGVKTKFKKIEFGIGNEKLYLSQNLLSKEIENKLDSFRNQGKTISFLWKSEKIIGFIVFEDEIREDAKNLINYLRTKNIRTVIATGDTSKSANYIAKSIGVDEVYSSLLPEDKLRIIKKEQKDYGVVGMLGDGINDAPSLKQADISFVMNSGSDLAIESGSITLMNEKLNSIINTIELSRDIMRNIHQNLFFAFIYNIVGIGLATGVFYYWLGWALTPMFAAVAMSLSSVSVIVNALRINK